MNFDENSSSQLVDPEIEHFIEVENQKRLFKALVFGLTDKCWDFCIGKLSNSLDGKTQNCLTNCVERFFDVTNFVVNRLEKTPVTQEELSFE